MQRRLFLKTAAAAALVAAAPLGLAGCGSLTRADLAQGPGARPPAGLDQTDWEILRLASLSPSGHNSQPWLVRVQGPGKWIIEADFSRRLPAVDPDNRELFLSLGAFAQCLAEAARIKGRSASFQVLAQGSQDSRVLAVDLQKAPAQGNPNRLLGRRTLRKGQLDRELAARDADFLLAAAGRGAVYFPRNGSHAQCIAQGTIGANQAQSGRAEVHRELAEWMRFSNASAAKHRDGLSVAAMELGGLAGFYLRNFMNKKDVTSPDFIKRGLEMAVRQARQGAGWVIISTPGQAPADLIEAGRAYCRLNLAARERMVAVHPMTQMLEEKSGQAEIAREHRGMKIIPQFILRVGYVEKYPAPVSLRRPAAWFVKAG